MNAAPANAMAANVIDTHTDVLQRCMHNPNVLVDVVMRKSCLRNI
jgi:hypothetical protein